MPSTRPGLTITSRSRAFIARPDDVGRQSRRKRMARNGTTESVRPTSARRLPSFALDPVFLSFLTTGAIQALNVVSGVILARSLGPHDRGELAAVMLWPALLAAVGGLGLADGATFHTAKRNASPGEILGTSAVIVLVQSFLLVLLGLGVIPLVMGSYDDSVANIAILYLAF